jgi:hypothetical protein
MNAPTLYPLIDPAGEPVEGLSGEGLLADGDGLVYTLRDDEPALLGELVQFDDGRVIIMPIGAPAMSAGETASRLAGLGGRRHFNRRRVLRSAAMTAATGGASAPVDVAMALRGLGASWWAKNRKTIGLIGAGAAGTALLAAGATKGTGFNDLLTKGYDTAKQFLTTSGGGAAAPDGAAAASGAPAPGGGARPAMRTASTRETGGRATVQGSVGGKVGPILLIAGLGIGALALMRAGSSRSRRKRR